MALDVSALTNYVIENEDQLMAKSLFTSRTSDIIRSEGTLLVGVKSSQKINLLDTDAIFQSGTGCTRTSSGTTTITQRTVTVGDIAVVEDICVNTLNTKYTSKALAQGSDPNKLPFEQEYTDLKAATISKQLEVAIWQGDTSHGNANLSKFDGLIKLIDNAGTAVAANTTSISTGTGITSSNIIGIIDRVVANIPADVQGKDDVRVFIGWDKFTVALQAYTAANYFAYAPTGGESKAAAGEFVIPGTYYKLTAVHGLDSTSRIFAMRTSNLFGGTDLSGEEDKWSMMEDQFKDYLRFKAHFKYGVNVAFPNEVVSFKLV